MPLLKDVYLGIVCPMANEGTAAVEFTKAVLAQCDPFARVTFFAIFDRVSKDESYDWMREFAATEPRLNVVFATENRCVVDAYIRGYKEALAAGCDWILEIDAGFSHQPEQIPRFFPAIENGYDAAFGSRFMEGSERINVPMKRYLVSRGGTFLSNLTLGTKLTDMTSGFQLFSRSALAAILEKGIRSRAHFFQTEMKTHCRDLHTLEVPITYRSPSASLSQAVVGEAFRELAHLRKMTAKRPKSDGGKEGVK